MIEISHFQQLVACLLSPNNAERNQAEATLNQLAPSDPENFTLYCMQLLK